MTLISFPVFFIPVLACLLEHPVAPNAYFLLVAKKDVWVWLEAKREERGCMRTFCFQSEVNLGQQSQKVDQV